MLARTLAGTLGDSTGAGELDANDPDSDISDELQVILSYSDRDIDDCSITMHPVVHTDFEDAEIFSEDDTKKPFDFTSNLKLPKLNESVCAQDPYGVISAHLLLRVRVFPSWPARFLPGLRVSFILDRVLLFIMSYLPSSTLCSFALEDLCLSPLTCSLQAFVPDTQHSTVTDCPDRLLRSFCTFPFPPLWILPVPSIWDLQLTSPFALVPVSDYDILGRIYFLI